MHNIMYWEYPEKTNENAIRREVVDYVNSHGDKYGTDNVQFLSCKVYNNRAAAEEFISSVDKGWYGGYAVKFFDYSKVADSKKIIELRKKIEETALKKNEYETAHSVKQQKAAYVGCPCCGSKLNRERIKSEKCPLCHTDLRSATTLERLTSFDARIKEYRKKMDEEKFKEKKKAEIKWLVKFEYHS